MNNLKKIREARGLSRQELADKVKTSRQTVYYIEVGKINISAQLLLPLCQALDCTPNDLYNECLNINNLDKKEQIKMIPISYYNEVSASAGNDSYINSEKSEVINIDERQLIEMGINGNYQNIRIIRAKGDSMYPTIKNNDLLFIDITVNDLRNNKIYVISEEGLLKVKRIGKKSPLSNDFEIKSDNQNNDEYPPYPLKIEDLGDRIRIIGLVVFFCRSL